MKELKLKYNPFKIEDENIILLKKIEKKLLELIEAFAEKESLSLEAKAELKSLITSAIIERKSEYFFRRSMGGFSNHLRNVTSILLNNDAATENPYNSKDMFYVKNTRHTVTYE